MTMQVVRPGLFTTVQDGGRFGWQSVGIGPGGAMDQLALRVANALVGNDQTAAVLEITMTGPLLRFEHDALLAMSGDGFAATIDGAPVPRGRAVLVRGGMELQCGSCASGCRAVVAVAGGIDVPVVLGSRSTNLRAHFGGFAGRALRAGDLLPVGTPSREAVRLMTRLALAGAGWHADHAGFAREISPGRASGAPLRLLPGSGSGDLDESSRAALDAEPFRVSTRSDRMGYRLEGPALVLSNRREMPSEGVAWGTVQLPPDGQPIILLADRQTTGGYPVIGHVASVDRSALASARPGDQLRFASTTLAAARRAHLDHAHMFRAAAQALRAQRAGERA